MYNYIKGTINRINAKNITIECHDIGYLINTPNPYSYELNSEIILFTYLHVREDVFELYGFKTEKERDFFLQLISVKGLGPKGALAILASGDTSEIIDAIESGNTKYLQRFPGVGPKASQQIVLDLHGKLNLENISVSNKQDPKVTKTIEALKNLGYKGTEIKNITPILEANTDKTIGELIKLALKKMY